MLFKVNMSFTQEPTLGHRTSAISKAFGVSVNRSIFFIFNNTEIDIRPGDVVYVTGDSGGGKSLLLRELTKRLSEYSHLFGEICAEADLKIDPDEVLIDSIGKSVEEGISYLSFAGLNDAYLFLRRYSELSDGQKYRYKIAKMLSINKDVFIFDEFCSNLDRETAKVVAFCIQKLVRRAKKTLIVATAHDDLIEDLAPSVLVRKNYGYLTDIIYPGRSINTRCSLMDNITIEEGTIDDWHSLEYFHYRAGIPYGIRRIFTGKIKDRVLGAIIYSNSPLSNQARNKYLGRVADSTEINNDFLIISRVVVLPKFRGIGLAVKLVKETLPLVNRKYVETIAVMAKYNPFFAKAGMKEVKYEPNKDELKVLQSLQKFSFNTELCANTEYNLQIINKLSKEQLSELAELLSKARNVIGNLVGRIDIEKEDAVTLLHDKTTLAEAIHWLATIAQPKCYYVWENPELMLEVKAK